MNQTRDNLNKHKIKTQSWRRWWSLLNFNCNIMATAEKENEEKEEKEGTEKKKR